jgi:hypothetical protein
MAKATKAHSPSAKESSRSKSPSARKSAGEPPEQDVNEESGLSVVQAGSTDGDRLDIRELRGTGGIRPDYDYKALRTESI